MLQKNKPKSIDCKARNYISDAGMCAESRPVASYRVNCVNGEGRYRPIGINI